MSAGSIRVAAVVGATASGKTALAVSLAERLDGEVISADSMQVYRALPIATAQPSEEEKRGVPHHLIGFLPPEESFSAAAFCRLGHAAIADVAGRGRLPIVCGGTGLYVDALLDNILFAEIPEDAALRASLNRAYDEAGGDAMLARPRAIDPETADRLHPADRKRIVRGLEVYTLSGTTMSEFNRRSRACPDRYRTCLIGVGYRDRSRLYERIDRRVDAMMAAGLPDEVRDFYEHYGKPGEDGLLPAGTLMQAIGCKELLPWIRGEQTKEEAVARLKQETRRFAKRQLTWFRRNDKINWIYADEAENDAALVDRAEAVIREKLGYGKEYPID